MMARMVDQAACKRFLRRLLRSAIRFAQIASFYCATIASANAQLQISTFFVDLYSGSMSSQIFAANNGDETLYLKITAQEVVNPGEEYETVRNTVDPRELGLLAAPQRLVVEPGQEKRIRLVALEIPDTDRFYKVTVTPVVGEVESEELVGVKILVAFAAWVFVRPEEAKPIMRGRRERNELVIRNDGTTHAELTAGKQCASARENDCKKIDRFRVFAGKEKRIALPMSNKESTVEFNVVYAGQVEKATF